MTVGEFNLCVRCRKRAARVDAHLCGQCRKKDAHRAALAWLMAHGSPAADSPPLARPGWWARHLERLAARAAAGLDLFPEGRRP